MAIFPSRSNAQEMIGLVESLARGAVPVAKIVVGNVQPVRNIPPGHRRRLQSRRGDCPVLNSNEMVREMIECFLCEMDNLFPQMRAALEKARPSRSRPSRTPYEGNRSLPWGTPYQGSRTARGTILQVERRHPAEAEEAVNVLEHECMVLKAALTEHPLAAKPKQDDYHREACLASRVGLSTGHGGVDCHFLGGQDGLDAGWPEALSRRNQEKHDLRTPCRDPRHHNSTFMPTPPLVIRLRHSPAFAAQSHGWCRLAPFSLDGDRMDWAVRLPKGGARRVTIRWSGRSDAVRVAVPGRKIGEADREFLRSRVRWMFRADEDFTEFWDVPGACRPAALPVETDGGCCDAPRSSRTR